MRSRFSAFTVGDAAYLLATWHPSARPDSLELDPGLEWRQLEIVGTTAGGAEDPTGTVEFVATFWEADGRRFGQQREHSAFSRVDGRWVYVGPTG